MELIMILDDDVVENVEFFNVIVEAINEEGGFPVVTLDNNRTVTMRDNDGNLLHTTFFLVLVRSYS